MPNALFHRVTEFAGLRRCLFEALTTRHVSNWRVNVLLHYQRTHSGVFPRRIRNLSQKSSMIGMSRKNSGDFQPSDLSNLQSRWEEFCDFYVLLASTNPILRRILHLSEHELVGSHFLSHCLTKTVCDFPDNSVDE